VLLKEFGERGFVFFTNLLSRKAQDLRREPRAALTFFWPDFGEQVRIEGVVESASELEADSYFRTRPRLSQLGSWASEQSQHLASREVLLERVAKLSHEFEGQPVPRPPHWGGLRLVPQRFEFWTAEPHRLHDRVVFERDGARWSRHLVYP
jgi:pyridoxamine 5'-phosphate oxidase